MVYDDIYINSNYKKYSISIAGLICSHRERQKSQRSGKMEGCNAKPASYVCSKFWESENINMEIMIVFISFSKYNNNLLY